MNYKGSYSGGTSYSVDDVAVYTDGVAYRLFKAAASGTACHDVRYWERVEQPLQEAVTLFHSMLTSINSSISSAQTANTKLSAMIAPEYTKTTYSEGDIRTHSGKLYKAKQDIETAENWTAAHWEETTVGGELTSLAGGE